MTPHLIEAPLLPSSDQMKDLLHYSNACLKRHTAVPLPPVSRQGRIVPLTNSAKARLKASKCPT